MLHGDFAPRAQKKELKTACCKWQEKIDTIII
jgi:hypothetical protein